MTAARHGVWTAQFDFQPAERVRQTAQELERLGYGSIWVGENVGREPFTQAAILLAATNRIVVATGVANIWARDPLTTLAAQYTLAEAYPGRFVLGIGVSHARLVADVRGHSFDRPLATMRHYLAEMDRLAERYRAVRPVTALRVLAALGPRMLHLAAEQADGAHTYLVPPQHTEQARKAVGADRLVIVEQAVVLETNPTLAREIARRHLRRYLPLPNYTNNLRRLGFADADFADNGSDRLVDTLVAWGDADAVTRRVGEHYDAGADQVCIQALDADFHTLPTPQWRQLAAPLSQLAPPDRPLTAEPRPTTATT
jgi:probable F420-dependent oxidoreductase